MPDLQTYGDYNRNPYLLSVYSIMWPYCSLGLIIYSFVNCCFLEHEATRKEWLSLQDSDISGATGHSGHLKICSCYVNNCSPTCHLLSSSVALVSERFWADHYDKRVAVGPALCTPSLKSTLFHCLLWSTQEGSGFNFVFFFRTTQIILKKGDHSPRPLFEFER